MTYNERIKQVIEPVPERRKNFRLLEIIKKLRLDLEKCILFCGTKKKCDYIEQLLREEHLRAMAIHGGKT
jgi:ATP-dependent RNA helicase DDX5/DBP2